MNYDRCEIIDAKSELVLFDNVYIPNDFCSRAKGLLGKKSLALGEGMLFMNCNSIHMWGMSIPLDVIFMDSTGNVIQCANNIKPWWFCFSSKASMTLEIAKGSIEHFQLNVGKKLEYKVI